MKNTTPIDVVEQLDRAQRLLILTHISPDGDAIGSLLGLGFVLRSRGQEAILVCADPPPPELLFLPGAGEILREAPAGPWDAVVALDAGDAGRLGPVFRPQEYGPAPIIVLDHHVTNPGYGSSNWIDAKAAATAQLVADLARALGQPLSIEAATCLLTGLVTDTQAFRTSNVDIRVLETAIRLMEAGADLAWIVERALNTKSFGTIRLWGPALAAVRLERGVIWTGITQEMRRQTGAPEGTEGGLVNFLLSALEANVSAVFSERVDGQIDVSMRSRPGYNVAAVALRLGGGGHPQAAGCTLPGPMAEVEDRVVPLLIAAQNLDNLSVPDRN